MVRAIAVESAAVQKNTEAQRRHGHLTMKPRWRRRWSSSYIASVSTAVHVSPCEWATAVQRQHIQVTPPHEVNLGLLLLGTSSCMKYGRKQLHEVRGRMSPEGSTARACVAQGEVRSAVRRHGMQRTFCLAPETMM